MTPIRPARMGSPTPRCGHDDPDTWGDRRWDSEGLIGDVDVRADRVYGCLWLPDGTLHVVAEDRVIGFMRTVSAPTERGGPDDH